MKNNGLLVFQVIKLIVLPLGGVDFWIIDNFHHPFYTYWPAYWGGTALDAPYSFIWQLWYLPTSIIGWYPFMFLMWLFDTALLLVVDKFHSTPYTLCFFFSSYLLFLFSPEDLLCFFCAVLGSGNKIMSIFSALVKLPYLAPTYVWQFIFSYSVSGQSDIISHPLGIPRYIFLGLWIIHPSFPYFKSYSMHILDRLL